VGSAIVGARSCEQLEDNMKALDLSLSVGLVAELDDATAEIKTTFGTNPDIWQVPSRIRHG